MKAILFSKYPANLMDGLISKLITYGIDVISYSENAYKIQNQDLSKIDVILYLNELASHKDYDRIKKAVNRYNKPIVYLSRKASAWPEQFKKAGIMLNKCIDDPIKDFDAFMTTYMKFQKSRLGHEQMIPRLNKYWPELKNATQLTNFITKLKDNSPEVFKKYAVHLDLTETPQLTEDQQYIQLQEEEIEKLKTALEESNLQLQLLKNKSNTSIDLQVLKKNAELLKASIGSNIFDAQKAFDKLVDLVEKV